MTQEDGLSRLTDRQLELIKLELELLEQRVIHIEGIQYHLRQFSMALWTLALGVGLGVSEVAKSDIRLIATSGLIPLAFLYLDAWYARAAQRFRTRRLEIANLVNSTGTTSVPESNFEGAYRNFSFLDFTASKQRRTDPTARYREHIAVKFIRTTRSFFYGFQILGTVLLATLLWLSGQTQPIYAVSSWLYFLPSLAALVFKKRMQLRLEAAGLSAASVAEDLFDPLEQDANPDTGNGEGESANPAAPADRKASLSGR